MINTTMKEFMDKFLRSMGFKPETDLLKFGNGNNKFKGIITFSIPAGHSCPFAKDCRSCATLKDSRSANTRSANSVTKNKSFNEFGIQDGPHTQFRCFTAIDEVMRPTVRNARWHNYLILLFTCLNGKSAVVKRIQKSLDNV